MTVRVFNYSDFTAGSRIILDEGTLDTFRAGGFLTGAWTGVFVFNRTGTTTDSTQFIFSASNSGSLRFGISFTSAGLMQITIGGNSRTFAGLTITTGTWHVFVIRKAAGTATPSAKLWNADTGAVVAGWTNGSGTLDDDANLWDQLQLGNRVNDFPINGKIAAGALFSSALNDTVGDTLGTGLQEWLDASPIAMWILDQAATTDPVLDEIGDADQTSIVDTAVDNADDPTAFDLNLGGGDATATPATVAGITSIPSPTIIASSVVSAVTTTGSTTIPTPTIVAGSALATPAVVSGTATIPTPAISTGVIVTAAVVTGSTTIATPTIQSSSIVSATTVSATTSIPTPGVIVGGSANVAATAVVATTTISTPTIQAGTTVTPTTVVGVTTIFSPTIPLSVQITPPVVSCAASIPTPTAVASSIISAVAVLGSTTIPTPGISTITAATPATVLCTTTIPTPSILVGSLVSPVTVLATTTIVFPTIEAIIPEPLPTDYTIDVTPVSIPIAHSGETVDVNVGVLA